jgi:uncharacterized protein YodC (DUF2158 family)
VVAHARSNYPVGDRRLSREGPICLDAKANSIRSSVSTEAGCQCACGYSYQCRWYESFGCMRQPGFVESLVPIVQPDRQFLAQPSWWPWTEPRRRWCTLSGESLVALVQTTSNLEG